MEASSTVVIKVKYGDTLRRFNAWIVDEELDLNMDGLRQKILSLFSFAPDTELMLTYIDEDSDVVALIDDDDLIDVVKQSLNPLRITVKLNAEKKGQQYNRSSGSCTPLNSSAVQQPLQNQNSGVSEILKTAPEPLRETLVKLSIDLASKTSSSAPGINGIVDYFSKVGLAYLGQLAESQHRVQSSTQGGVPDSSTVVTETEDLKLSKVSAAPSKVLSNVRSKELSFENNESMEKLKPEATTKNNEVKFHTVSGGSEEASSAKAFGFNAVAAALDSQNIDVAQTGNVSLISSAPVHPKSSVGKKEKVKKVIECHLNGKSHLTPHLPSVANDVGKFRKSFLASSNLPSNANNAASQKKVNKPSESKLGRKPASVSASDPVQQDYLDGWTRSVFPGAFGKSPGSIWDPSPGSLDLPDSFSGPSPKYECPFPGIAVGNVSAAPPYPASEAVPFRRSIFQNDGSENIFHRGVRCDGCGVHPITGPRFKSKVKVNYDLCSICFEEMGNYSDYIRMDRPAFNRHLMSYKGLYDAHARDQDPTLPQVFSGSKVKPGASKLDSLFIQDVNIIDGTIMAPLTSFTKIWRMRNNGTVVWPHKTQLIWIGGDKLSYALSVEVEIPATGLMMDQELDVAVDFFTPELPGRYISYWRMASPSGQKFGQRVWVHIQVDASVKEMPRKSVRSWNLNLPPVSSCLTGPESTNVDSAPMVEGSHPELDTSRKTVELVEPVVDLKPNTEQELKFPINNSLLVGSGVSSSLPSASPSISYPIIDLSDVTPPVYSVPHAVYYPLPPPPSAAPVASARDSTVELPGNKQAEEELLRELEEMGFKQVDLNKEILRLNEYDLEQSVYDLCGVADWDPILEELREMGFNDTEMNKMLLKKNNGSVKRVVMDLIAGQEI